MSVGSTTWRWFEFAVAEVIQEVDVGRHAVAEVDQDVAERLLHRGLAGAVARRLVALEPGEHRRGHVELDRELVMRDGGGDLVDLALHRVVVEGIERGVQPIDQEQPDDGVRRHQIDLEFGAGRDFSRLLQAPEDRIGILGDIRIEQVVEAHVLRRDAVAQRVALPPGPARVDAEEFPRLGERRVVGEHRLEPGDPVAALAGLPVGQALDPRPERGTHGREHLLGVGHRHTADQMDVACGHVDSR